MVVDDSPSNLLLVERILQAAGYTHVQTISRSSEVIAAFEADPPDLLLLDLQMPEPDGFEVMRLLAHWTTGETYIPELVLTADASPETRAAGSVSPRASHSPHRHRRQPHAGRTSCAASQDPAF